MKKFWVCLTILFLAVLGIGVLAVNFGVKVTLMADRKDAKLMIEELRDKFGTDYRLYEDIPVEKITIESYDGLKLKGYYHNVHPNSKKVVLINHGYTANHYVTYQFTDVFFEEGFNVLLVDMRSHGESEGEYASFGYNESKDISLWIDWIKSKVGDGAYIGLHGQSMGAATVMLYAGAHPEEVKFVVEDCGFSNAEESVKFQFKQSKVPIWPLYNLVRNKVNRKYNFDFSEISPKNAIVNSNVPTLFIHGMNDEIVPTWMAEDMYKAKSGVKDRLYLVEGAGHMESSYKNKERYKEEIRSFLKEVENN